MTAVVRIDFGQSAPADLSEDAGEWFTAAELAKLRLPGLPSDKSAMNRRIRDERWQLRSANGEPMSRPRVARGGGTEYHVSLLPGPARLELARRGVDLVINDRPDGQDLAGTLEEIRVLCPSITAIEANVFQRSECERLVSAAIETKGRIDILVSNPANILWCEYLKFDPTDFERVIAGTLIGGFHISQLV
ncbi:MAG: hypothetical protein COC10_09360, partial [Sphingobium sp.]